MYSGWQEKGCVRDINYMITEKFLFAACHRKDRSTRVRYKKLTEFDDGSYAVSYYPLIDCFQISDCCENKASIDISTYVRLHHLLKILVY